MEYPKRVPSEIEQSTLSQLLVMSLNNEQDSRLQERARRLAIAVSYAFIELEIDRKLDEDFFNQMFD